MARTESGELSVVGPAAAPSRLLLLHLMFWVVGGLPAYWLLQQHTVHSISRKFIWTVAAPVSAAATINLYSCGGSDALVGGLIHLGGLCSSGRELLQTAEGLLQTGVH